jgi:thiamine-phosphate pyrophosphorylase
MSHPYSLYLVTDRQCLKQGGLLDVVQAAVQGGVSCVQLREKKISTREYITLAKQLKDFLRPQSIPLFINDRVDVAMAAQADGVHLGASDMNYQDAKALLPDEMKLAMTIDHLSQVDEFNCYALEYLGDSAIFPSQTKKDIQHYWSKSEMLCLQKKTRHPLIGIGGIDLTTVKQLADYHLDGIAVSSVVCAAPSLEQVRQNADQLRREVQAW